MRNKNKSENLIYDYVKDMPSPSKSAYKRAMAMSEANYYAVMLRIKHGASTPDDHVMMVMYEVTHVGVNSTNEQRNNWMRAYEEKLNDAG